MNKLVIFLALVACASAADWSAYKTRFGKSYRSLNEEQLRLRMFEKNKRIIEQHNKRFEAGEESYDMGLNEFSDLSFEEFQALYLSSFDAAAAASVEQQIDEVSSRAAPSSLDWRSKGAVTAVKHQGSCGSCWTFSAAGCLEGAHFIKTGKLVTISEQNILDCSSRAPYNNMGCNGGYTSQALQYIIDNGGVNYMSNYPYEGAVKTCRYNRNSIAATMRSRSSVARTEAALKEATANKGPIAVSVVVTDKFQNYKSGVFNDNTCAGKVVNHGVLVVGYGNDSAGDYWIVKNSWGKSWGESGYIRMSRNRSNQCQIASYGLVAVV
ncbi:maker144 [Drosophila busckii]|uniref:cathepsin L n=1 Tax=Drosophila busckii TaxID=30019 RepID=A0A0M3QVP1_DROBS|nr:digestive cysteine proteinase 1 [Drosophila busckii]ALC42733.1 maker144 [Drosophila busckii]